MKNSFEEFFFKNQNKAWELWRLSKNPNITIKIIRYYSDNSLSFWNWQELSSNPAVDLKMVRDNPDLPWNLKYLSSSVVIIAPAFSATACPAA